MVGVNVCVGVRVGIGVEVAVGVKVCVMVGVGINVGPNNFPELQEVRRRGTKNKKHFLITD
jgi:hypothetical protein